MAAQTYQRSQDQVGHNHSVGFPVLPFQHQVTAQTYQRYQDQVRQYERNGGCLQCERNRGVLISTHEVGALPCISKIHKSSHVNPRLSTLHEIKRSSYQLFISWDINSWLTTYQTSTLDCQQSTSEIASWGEKLWETQKSLDETPKRRESNAQVKKSSWHRKFDEIIDFLFFFVFSWLAWNLCVFNVFFLIVFRSMELTILWWPFSSTLLDASSTPPRTWVLLDLEPSTFLDASSTPPRPWVSREKPVWASFWFFVENHGLAMFSRKFCFFNVFRVFRDCLRVCAFERLFERLNVFWHQRERLYDGLKKEAALSQEFRGYLSCVHVIACHLCICVMWVWVQFNTIAFDLLKNNGSL